MTFTEKFTQRCREIDVQSLAKSPEPIEVPVQMQVPLDDQWCVKKRSNKGYDEKVLIRIPQEEAEYWCKVFNKREAKKRELILKRNNLLPDEVFLYDVVKQHSEEESLYYNPRPIIKEESPDIEIIRDVQQWVG